MTAPLFVVLVIVNSFMYKGLEIFLAYVSAWCQIVIHKIHRKESEKQKEEVKWKCYTKWYVFMNVLCWFDCAVRKEEWWMPLYDNNS
jgi:hypothetical protein